MTLPPSSAFLSVQPTDQGFEYWRTRPYLSETMQQQLQDANVLIVPLEDIRGVEGPVFLRGTDQLFQTLRRLEDQDVKVDVTIDDADYKELSLYSDSLALGSLVMTLFVVPLVVNVVSQWINNHIGAKSAGERVKLQLVVQSPDGRVTQLDYDGPAAQFESELRPALQALGGGGQGAPGSTTGALPPVQAERGDGGNHNE